MNAVTLLDQLRAQGFSLRVDPSGRLLLRPGARATEKLRAEVSANKAALLALLQSPRCDAEGCELAIAEPRDELVGGWCVWHYEAVHLLSAATVLCLPLERYRTIARTGDTRTIVDALVAVWLERGTVA